MHSHSRQLSEQAVTRVRILRHFNVATAAISHWSVSEIDTQLKNQKNTQKQKKQNVTLAEKSAPPPPSKSFSLNIWFHGLVRKMVVTVEGDSTSAK